MQVAVIGGTGYVGLTTAVCLATKGHTVYCVGRNREKIMQLQNGEPPIFEEGLEALLKEVLASKNLMPTTDLKESVRRSNFIFICVGTPSRKDGSADLSQIEEVSKQIGAALKETRSYCVVVVKSTVVPGTTEELVLPLVERFSGKKVGVDFGLCMNPEFLREGQAVKDFMYPKEQGIVIGEIDKRSGDGLFEIYKQFEAKILRTTIRAAEMIKYARNAYLAKDVSFSNEIANICQKLDVDYLEVKKGIEMDARIGEGRFLNAGLGFGGSCFPKDVKALIAKARSTGLSPKILDATIVVNDSQPDVALKMLEELIGEVKGKKIAVLGLAFKPGTDDMREAPSIKVVESLIAEGCQVYVYDPKAEDNARRIFGETVQYARSAKEALKDADGCIIVTEWPEFSNPELYTFMRGKVIIDGRKSLDFKKLQAGFIYHGIGFPKAVKT